MATQRQSRLLIILAVVVGASVGYIFQSIWCNKYPQQAIVVSPLVPYQPSNVKQDLSTSSRQTIMVIFTGRWKFLRINFPYIFRELRENGGIIDKVLYMMVNYDRETEEKLKQLTQKANQMFEREIFELRYMGHPSGKPPKKFFIVYNELFPELIANPYNKYLKMDDDIVYIHPHALERMVESKKTCQGKCFLHFGNIVTNWRSSISHERMGLFKNPEVNPTSLKFDYNPNANCGWKSPECADLVLKAFLYYYDRGEVDKYLFDGCEQLSDRRRYSINFMMLDKDVLNIEALLKAGPILEDDERWWTQVYSPSSLIKEPNCIVGEAFVVHFSYSVTMDAMLKKGYREKFEKIVQKEIGSKMPKDFWSQLEYKV